MSNLVTEIDQWLPQTQCGQCGYPRCLDYANAIANKQTDINQCPPGDNITITGLAQLLRRPVLQLNPAYGIHRDRTLAVIDEALCIGCKLCIQACPVDAIVGTAKLMHTVIADECTGCELCLPPCPMDCIKLIPYSSDAQAITGRWPDYASDQVERARQRTQARLNRPERTQEANGEKHFSQFSLEATSRDMIRREIGDAVARVRTKKSRKN